MEKGIGILGGTFDPPHNAHLFLSSVILNLPFIKQLIIIPTFKPKYKDCVTDYVTRSLMCHRAFDNYRTLILESTKSYVFEQLIDLKQQLIEQYRKLPLYMFVGDDWDVNTWKHPEKIRKLCKIIYIRRNRTGKIYQTKIEPFMKKDFTMTLPITLDMSSTRIRYMVQCGIPISGLVHPFVESCIKNNNLYEIPKA